MKIYLAGVENGSEGWGGEGGGDGSETRSVTKKKNRRQMSLPASPRVNRRATTALLTNDKFVINID